MYILGVSGLYHDAAAAIIRDGEIVAAAQEERFTRKKHDPSLPVHAMQYCLKKAGIAANELECVVFYDNPLLTLDRFLGNLQMVGGDTEELFSLSFERLFGRKLWIHRLIREALGSLGKREKLLVAEHHISHGAKDTLWEIAEMKIGKILDGFMKKRNEKIWLSLTRLLMEHLAKLGQLL